MRTGIIVGHAGARLREAVEDARAAEAAGLDLVASGEHAWEGYVILGALAARTERVELHTTSNWTRTPVTTALAVSTVDELSGGRFRLSLGAMPQAWSEGVHGIGYARPVERMRDYIGAVRAALAARPGTPVAYEGGFYRFDGYERPNEPPPFTPRIYQSVTRPGMTSLAGEIADGVVLNAMVSAAWIDEVAWPALREGLERGGRPRDAIDVGILRMCAVDDDPERARELLRAGLGFYFITPYFREVLAFHGFDEEIATRTVSDRVIEAVALAGTPAEVREQLRRYERTVDFVQVTAPLELDAATTREQTRRIIDALTDRTTTG